MIFDESSLAPLLAKDAKMLKDLVKSASPASAQLVDLLIERCDAVKAAWHLRRCSVRCSVPRRREWRASSWKSTAK